MSYLLLSVLHVDSLLVYILIVPYFLAFMFVFFILMEAKWNGYVRGFLMLFIWFEVLFSCVHANNHYESLKKDARTILMKQNKIEKLVVISSKDDRNYIFNNIETKNINDMKIDYVIHDSTMYVFE
jgi:hypothetical protein